MLYEGNVSPEFREIIKENATQIRENFKFLKEDMQNLVKIRNSLFKNLINISPCINIVRNKGTKSYDLLNFLRYYEKRENDPNFSIFKICGIEMRQKGEEPETDIYMTDEDNMSVINSLNG